MQLELPSTIHTLLIVEDEPAMIKLYKKSLSKMPLNLIAVKTGTEALEYLKQQTPATILLDLGLPDIDGKEVLNYVKQQALSCPVIIITWQDSVNSVVEMMQAGAFNYLEKPIAVERLQVTVHNAIQQYELQHYIESHLRTIDRDHYHGMLGASKPMQTLYQIIDNVARSQVDILIMGETGTGKELCAKALHEVSYRATHPFIVVNCAAIPDNLMESQLFGYVKGAFTGAFKDREGAASQADGGTLFFDEIGDLQLPLQKVLLRFIQTKTFQKIGGNDLEQVDVRIISATNRDLLADVKAGRFREDLYYRLNIVPIKLPSLRERGDDILLLARVFLYQFAQQEKKSFQKFTPAAEQVLLQYSWPGNIRQLQNTIQNIVLFNPGEQITAELLRVRLHDEVKSDEITSALSPALPSFAVAKTTLATTVSITSNHTIRSFEEIEQEVILATIEYCQGDVVEAAKLLKIGATTIYRKLREWNVTLKRCLSR